MEIINIMWLLVIVLFFQINAASGASPIDLQLLFNDRLQEFIASDNTVSKAAHEDKDAAVHWNDTDKKDGKDELWQALAEDWRVFTYR